MEISCEDCICALCVALYSIYSTWSFSIICMIHYVTHGEAFIIHKQTFLKIHQWQVYCCKPWISPGLLSDLLEKCTSWILVCTILSLMFIFIFQFFYQKVSVGHTWHNLLLPPQNVSIKELMIVLLQIIGRNQRFCFISGIYYRYIEIIHC